MANYINIYTNNPSTGATDGTLVSTDGTQTSPISVTLDSSSAETQAIKCSIRTNTGYTTIGDTIVKPQAYNATAKTYGATDKWKIAIDNSFADSTAALAGASWQDSITISDSITDTNKIFWLKAISTADEGALVDTSVRICASGKLQATA